MKWLDWQLHLMTWQLNFRRPSRRNTSSINCGADLTAWVGHDLRTPLTSVRAMIEALADGMVEDPETVQRYLKTAQRDICSLSGLIDDLFEISQMDAGGLIIEREPGSMADLISDTLESFSELGCTKRN
jgi:signal transduction histidine kinase